MKAIKSVLILACLTYRFADECRADTSGALNCGISINVCAPQTQLGSNMVWTLTMVNGAPSNQTCVVTRNVNAVLYTGVAAGLVASTTTTNTLSPNETNVLAYTVTPAQYSQFTGITDTFQMDTVVEAPGTGDLWFAPVGGRIVLSVPTDILTLSPQSQIAVGHSVTTTVSYLNPFPISLTGVKVCLSVDEHFTSGSSRIIAETSLGTIATNAYATMCTNFIAMTAGTGVVWATITASNLTAVGTSSEIPITE